MGAFDLTKKEGQFNALLVLWGICVGLRCAGFSFMENDHTLFAGAILTLLKTNTSTDNK